jgi:hypothetical protein
MANNQHIKCPSCGENIDVNSILIQQLETEIHQKLKVSFDEKKQKVTEESLAFQEEKKLFELQKLNEKELFDEQLSSQLKEQEKILEAKIKKQLTEEQSAQLNIMQAELNEKSQKLIELNASKAEIEKLKREKNEMQGIADIAAQEKMSVILSQEKEKIQKAADEKNELKLKELQKKIDDQRLLTEEMKRKQEQGSMQFQGEVQELAIEEWLQQQYPLDTIDEIKKGARGGDCIQIVNTRTTQNCGKIYYESKRTKKFEAIWIDKFKADMRVKGADIGVIVTESMPTEMDRMGLKDGVYICTFQEFKSLSGILRESIIQINSATTSQLDSGDKMHILYDYLTSNIFRMQVEAIVEGFTAMKTAIESEKRSMYRIWKEREKQIEKVTINTIEMHASIRGIAGTAIQAVKALELTSEEIDTDTDSIG